jgi:hypothetical protein
MEYLSARSLFEPEEMTALKAMFDAITAEPWFDNSETAKEDFAKYLLETAPDAPFDAVKHRLVAETSARMFYSREHAIA